MLTLDKYKIDLIDWPETSFLTKRGTFEISKLKDFFSGAYDELYTAAGNLGLKSPYPFAIYHAVDDLKKQTDVSAAVALNGTKDVIAGLTFLTIPKAKALRLSYQGAYEDMTPAYQALEKYLADNKLNKKWVLEEYLSDPGSEKDPAKWKTNIYFILE